MLDSLTAAFCQAYKPSGPRQGEPRRGYWALSGLIGPDLAPLWALMAHMDQGKEKGDQKQHTHEFKLEPGEHITEIQTRFVRPVLRLDGAVPEAGLSSTWTPKVYETTAFWAVLKGFGQLFYILLEV